MRTGDFCPFHRRPQLRPSTRTESFRGGTTHAQVFALVRKKSSGPRGPRRPGPPSRKTTPCCRRGKTGADPLEFEGRKKNRRSPAKISKTENGSVECF